MDLVNEEDVAWFEISEDRAEVTYFFDGRSRSHLDTDTHFFGDDVSKSCFPESCWTVEKHVINIFRAFLGGLNKDIEMALDLVLANIFSEILWPKGVIQVLIFSSLFWL